MKDMENKGTVPEILWLVETRQELIFYYFLVGLNRAPGFRYQK